MNLKDLEEEYNDAAETISSTLRALVISGIGIGIIFNTTVNSGLPLEKLYVAAKLLVIGLCLDGIHYYWNGFFIGITYFIKRYIKKVAKDENISLPLVYYIIQFMLFFGKAVPIVWAYIYIVRFLFNYTGISGYDSN